MNFSFYINNCTNSGGPGIFGNRLKRQLEKNGHTFVNPYTSGEAPQLNLSIIQGERIKGCPFNPLRLDGLYFDSRNPDTDKLNAPIFKSFKELDYIVYQSEFSKLMYHSFVGQRPYCIIPNGIDQKEYVSPAKDLKTNNDIFSRYSKICVASASWRRHKRLEEIIRAFRSPRLKDVLLIALGGFEYIKDKSSLTPNVLLTPLFEPHQTSSIYMMADAMIHISWLDWCPNTVVEALSCGVPVLCSHNGGTKELVKEDGLVVQIEDDYKIGERVPLYSPPAIDEDELINGILKIVEAPKGFKRPDLDIKHVASEYEKYLTPSNI